MGGNQIRKVNSGSSKEIRFSSFFIKVVNNPSREKKERGDEINLRRRAESQRIVENSTLTCTIPVPF